MSDGHQFGDPGFYFTVLAEPDEAWARYARTMKESVSLRVQDGALTATHRFAVFGLPFLELRYELTRKTSNPRSSSGIETSR